MKQLTVAGLADVELISRIKEINYNFWLLNTGDCRPGSPPAYYAGTDDYGIAGVCSGGGTGTNVSSGNNLPSDNFTTYSHFSPSSFVLPANATYRLLSVHAERPAISAHSGGYNGGYYRWYNVTNAAYFGTRGYVYPGSPRAEDDDYLASNHGFAVGYVTVGGSTETVSLRVESGTVFHMPSSSDREEIVGWKIYIEVLA